MNKHASNPVSASYEGDFHRWAAEQGRLLRERPLDLVDFENVAEEIETLGRTERREVESRLAVTLSHLLKWQFHPQKRKGGWEATIRLQRRRLAKILRENPSLRQYPREVLADAWLEARLVAAEESSLDFEAFPENCPYTADQVLDEGFLPT